MRVSNSITVIVVCTFIVPLAVAHPASGIVVDERGQVFFLDTGRQAGFAALSGGLTPREA
jgi:hypothetical protein